MERQDFLAWLGWSGMADEISYPIFPMKARISNLIICNSYTLQISLSTWLHRKSSLTFFLISYWLARFTVRINIHIKSRINPVPASIYLNKFRLNSDDNQNSFERKSQCTCVFREDIVKVILIFPWKSLLIPLLKMFTLLVLREQIHRRWHRP